MTKAKAFSVLLILHHIKEEALGTVRRPAQEREDEIPVMRVQGGMCSGNDQGEGLMPH